MLGASCCCVCFWSGGCSICARPQLLSHPAALFCRAKQRVWYPPAAQPLTLPATTVVPSLLPSRYRDALSRRLVEVAPHLGQRDAVQAPLWLNGAVVQALGDKAGAPAAAEPLRTPISNFFMTDAISRASQTMAKCVLARQQMRVAA